MAVGAREVIGQYLAAMERGDGSVESERANVYTVRDGGIVAVWIFEADQYAVDQLMAQA